MGVKQTLISGVIGAVGIYAARKVSAIEPVLDSCAPFNNKTLPLIGNGPMVRNSWSFAFVAIPAVAAYYLSN